MAHVQEPAIRVLVTAFAPVPGSSPHAGALIGMSAALHAELDLITIKTEAHAHIDRIKDARMFRVPVGVGAAVEQRDAFGRAVDRQLRGEHYDVVHVRGPFEGVIVARHQKQLGYRFVYEVATWPDEAEGMPAEDAWTKAHELCLDEADLVLVPTQAAARSLAERGYAGKVAVVHPGVDVNTFDWWPIGHDETMRLLYLGTFAADRDLSAVLGAIREVARTRPVEALIAGDPDPDRRARLRRMVKAFELDRHVAVRGEPRAVALPTLIGAADVCLAPASATPRFQDFGDLPQPLLEYLACRRPVIAAGVPGVAEVLRDEQEGLLYPPGDEKTLADGIATMMADEKLRTRVVEAAYERVRSLFSDGARRRRIAEVYEMLMHGSQRYDAWSEGFSQEATGVIRVSSELFEFEDEDTAAATGDAPGEGMDERGDDTPHGEDTGDVIYAPADVHDDRPTPARPLPRELDTSPGLFPPDEDPDDLQRVPTRVETQVEGVEKAIEESTDEQGRPVSVEAEVDTGPVRAPGHDTNH